MPLQSDITSAVQGCTKISSIDMVRFFHQFGVKPECRHILTFVTHRGQEQSNVVVMGDKNSPAYCQRQIDHILRTCRSFARAYIDDIVIFSKDLDTHIEHLHQVLTILNSLRFKINPTKTHLGYPSLILLGQRVDAYGMTTDEEKIKAITALCFPITLKELETYLGLTGWLRSYVPYYTQIVESLQRQKTLLLKAAPHKGKARLLFITQTNLSIPSPSEQEAFNYF